MKTEKIMFAGFGGQGVMLIGQILAYAAMLEGKEVTYMPSYGPEMRGGTANCAVVISDKPISAPIITEATQVLAMNAPSFEKFKDILVKGGSLFINSSLIEGDTTRTDVVSYKIPATDLAQEMGNPKGSNVIMLGAFVEKTKIVTMKSIEKVLETVFTGSREKLLAINKKALRIWKG